MFITTIIQAKSIQLVLKNYEAALCLNMAHPSKSSEGQNAQVIFVEAWIAAVLS